MEIKYVVEYWVDEDEESYFYDSIYEMPTLECRMAAMLDDDAREVRVIPKNDSYYKAILVYKSKVLGGGWHQAI